VRGPRGVDPLDFDEELSADVRNVEQTADVVETALNAGFNIDDVIDGLYESGIPADYVDTVLATLENRSGSWN